MGIKKVKVYAHSNIDSTLTNIASIKANIYAKINQTKLEEVNHQDSDNNKYLYKFLDDTDLYESILCIDKLLNDIKTSDIDIDNTAIQVLIDIISKIIAAAEREFDVDTPSKKKDWYDRVKVIAKKLDKIVDRLIALLAAGIYTVRYGKQGGQSWIPAYSAKTKYYPKT